MKKTILFSIIIFCMKAITYGQHFCAKGIDNNIGAFSAELNEDYTKFKFIGWNVHKASISFIYDGQNVSLPNQGSQSQWFVGKFDINKLDCSSVKIGGYPLKNLEYLFYDYLAKYNNLPFCNTEGAQNTITLRQNAIKEMERMKTTIPSNFHDELNSRIKESTDIVSCAQKQVEKDNKNPIKNAANSDAGNNNPPISGTPVSPTNNKPSAQEVERQRKQAELDKTLQAIEQNQKNIAESQKVTEKVTSSVTNSITSILEAERQRKDAAEERNRISRLARYEKARVLHDKYYEQAQKGDDFAIEQLYNAYLLWDNYNDANKLIDNMFNKYRSKFATKIKMQKEMSIMSSEIADKRRYIKKAWLHPLLGAGLAYGSMKLGDKIDANAELGDATPGVWLQTAGILAGVYFVGSGLVNFGWSFSAGKNSDTFKDAQKRYESLKQLTVSISPSYNPYTNSPMMGMRLQF